MQGDGVVIIGKDAVNNASDTANVVEGNLIGTDISGNAALGNASTGVYVGAGAQDQFGTNASGTAAGATIGGSTAAPATSSPLTWEVAWRLKEVKCPRPTSWSRAT